MQDITFAKLPPEIHARIVKVDPDAAIPMLHATLALAAHEQGGIVYPATGKLHPHGFIASNPAIRKRIMPLLTEIEPRTLHKLLNDATVSESSEDALPSFDAEQCKRYLSEWRHLMQSTNDMASAEMKQVLNKIAESSDFGQSIDSASDQPSARPRSASEQRALGEHNRLRRLAVGAFAGKVFESNPQSILHDSDVKSLVRIAAFVKNPFISGQAMSFLTYNEQRAFVDERQNIQRPASHTFSSPYAARFFDLIENGLHAFIGGKEKRRRPDLMHTTRRKSLA